MDTIMCLLECIKKERKKEKETERERHYMKCVIN